MSKQPQAKAPTPPGPKPVVLKITGDWKEAVRLSLKKKKKPTSAK